MEKHSGGPRGATSARGARRLLWALVLGIVVLNLLVFLATMRKDSTEAPGPPDPGAEVGSRTNAL